MAGDEQHRLAAILFADIVNFSLRPQGVGLQARSRMLSAAHEILPGHQGRLANSAGDDIMAEFSSATDAVSFAMALQQKISDQNAALGLTHRFLLRIGIDAGQVVVEGELPLGDTVNMAKRTESLAAPGGICMTESVWKQVHEQLPRSTWRLGRVPTKNMKTPPEFYHLDPPGASWTYRMAHRFRLGLGQPVRMAALLVAAGLVLWAVVVLASLGEKFLPPSPAKLLARAQSQLDRYDVEGNVEQAINELVTVPEGSPQLAEAKGSLGLAYWRRYLETGELKTRTDAFNASSASLSINSNIPVAHLTLGLVAQDKGDLVLASNELARANALEREENGVALIKLAKVCDKLLQADKGAECIHKATGVQEKNWDFYNELAKYEFGRGEYAAALTNGLQAVRLSTHNSVAECNLANLYLALDDYEKHTNDAWLWLERSRISRTTPFYYFTLGQYYRVATNREQAVIAFRKAAELRPKDYRFWGNAGLTLKNAGMDVEAGEFLAKAISQAEAILPDTDDCLIRANVGLYQASLGHAEESLKALQQALGQCPDNGQVREIANQSSQFLGEAKEAGALQHLLDKQ